MYPHNIDNIRKETDHPFLNMYGLEVTYGQNQKGVYNMASRAKDIDHLKQRTRQVNADGVLIYSVYGEKKDRIVLVRQYRYPIDAFIYEFPAGLVEQGEDYRDAAVRELKEETGLTLHAIKEPEGYSRPFFTSVGMSDEACATVFGYAEGIPTEDFQEDAEDIRIVLADKAEVRRILKEENIAIMTAYMLMHFLNSPDGEPFGFLEE